jgi:hypothetical protein
LTRTGLDRLVAVEVLCAFAAPLAVAIAAAAEGLRVGLDPRLSVTVAVAAAVAAVCFVSSLVDWYYVLPRRDGLIGNPPCRSPGDSRWARVTWFWFLHRFVAAVATIGGVYAIAICLGLLLYDRYPAVVSGAGGITVILAVITFFARSYLQDILAVWRLLLGPTLALGEHLTARLDQQYVSGFVLNIAIDRVDLINGNDKLAHVPIAFFASGSDRDSKRSLCGGNCVRGVATANGKAPTGGHGGCLADTPGPDREPPRPRPRLLVL